MLKKDCSAELKEGEIWVGNTETSEAIPAYLSPMKTARLGNQAYDIKGDPIDPSYYRPLIIHRSEADLYDKIMMKRLHDARK